MPIGGKGGRFMKIFKSRIEIFKRGELTPKVFEMVVDHGEILEDEERFRMMTLGNEVKFYALDNEGKSIECSIEDYQKEPYYEFLKKKENLMKKKNLFAVN